MKQCAPYLLDLKNRLELVLKLQVPRPFQSPVERECPVCLTSEATVIGALWSIEIDRKAH